VPSFIRFAHSIDETTTTTMMTLHRSSLVLVAPLALAAAFSRPTFGTRPTASRLRAYDYALLFDCDGVILETEELHRVAYNAAFAEFDLTIDDKPVVWEVRV
jgi:hypothetical protein